MHTKYMLPKKPRKPALTALRRPDGAIQSRAAEEPLGKFGFRPRLDAKSNIHGAEAQAALQRVEPRPHARAEAEAVY